MTIPACRRLSRGAVILEVVRIGIRRNAFLIFLVILFIAAVSQTWQANELRKNSRSFGKELARHQPERAWSFTHASGQISGAGNAGDISGLYISPQESASFRPLEATV